MEKLIELLNEYEKQFTDRPNYFWYKDKMLWKYIFCELNWRNIDNQELMIISERYEFIKRLVENDKIVLEKVENIELPVDTKLRAMVDKNEKTCFNRLYTLKLLMRLSIQENPIKFLCSVLK